MCNVNTNAETANSNWRKYLQTLANRANCLAIFGKNVYN